MSAPAPRSSPEARPRSVAVLARAPRAVIFGATAGAPEVEALLGDLGVEFVAFADNSAAKQARPFRGKPVLPAEAAVRAARDGAAIVIASAHQRAIAEQLLGLGAPQALVFPFVSRMFAGHFGEEAIARDREPVSLLRARLADAESRAYLDALLAFRLTMDPLALRPNPKLTGFYAYSGCAPRPGGLIVDAGAYDGDSAFAFLDRLGGHARVLACEPFAANRAQLEENKARHRFGAAVTVLPLALGAAPGETILSGAGDGADPRARGAGSGAARVMVETVDRLCSDDRCDFLKVDVEGADLDVLEGARRTLALDAPSLAVASYHRADHLWRVPALIDRTGPGWRLHLGHHPGAPYECEVFAVHESRAA